MTQQAISKKRKEWKITLEMTKQVPDKTKEEVRKVNKKEKLQIELKIWHSKVKKREYDKEERADGKNEECKWKSDTETKERKQKKTETKRVKGRKTAQGAK